MKMDGNEKTKLKLQKNATLSDNWNICDRLGEVSFFAAGPSSAKKKTLMNILSS